MASGGRVKKKKGMLNRTLIVNKKLQLTFLVYSLTLCLWISVAGMVLQFIARDYLKVEDVSSAFILVFVGFVFLIGTTVVGGFLLTNRIAGPLFRLSSHMKNVAEGKPGEAMSFRKNDYFVEIIEPYNKILSELKNLRS